MPYVAQMRHIDRIRRLIEGPVPVCGSDAARLVSSYRRSLDKYHLGSASTKGWRLLITPELRERKQRKKLGLRASGERLSHLHETVRKAQYRVMLTDAQSARLCLDPPYRR